MARSHTITHAYEKLRTPLIIDPESPIKGIKSIQTKKRHTSKTRNHLILIFNRPQSTSTHSLFPSYSNYFFYLHLFLFIYLHYSTNPVLTWASESPWPPNYWCPLDFYDCFVLNRSVGTRRFEVTDSASIIWTDSASIIWCPPWGTDRKSSTLQILFFY